MIPCFQLIDDKLMKSKYLIFLIYHTVLLTKLNYFIINYKYIYIYGERERIYWHFSKIKYYY